MPEERRLRIKNAIEAALRDGFDPYGQVLGGKGSCVSEALRRLKEQGYDETKNKINGFLATQARLKAKGEQNFLPNWSLFSHPGAVPAKARSGKIQRMLFTSVQDDTDLHMGFWNNLQIFARYVGAEVMVGGFTYQQARHTDRMTLTNTFRPEVRDFLRFDPFEFGNVLFAAEMNTLPTAVRPLSGLHTYGRGRDTIFPHAKLAYETVPQTMGEYVPSVMTTGAVSLPNYIHKKAGLKAEFHHILGATIVEIDDEGVWCRPISATPDGSFQDLGIVVREGNVSVNNRIKAVSYGDIHNPSVSETVFDALWGPRADSLIDELKPEYQMLHDLIAFEAWSRYVRDDPIHRHKMNELGLLSMEGQVRYSAEFLRKIEREFCRTVVVQSNHDKRLQEWATKEVPREDYENAKFWHECNIAMLDANTNRDDNFDLLRWALKRCDSRNLDGIDFIPEGGSFVICQDQGGIECGAHGHLGPNGSRGSVVSLAKVGKRMTIGHGHSPTIHSGVYMSGMTGDLDQGYNKGPSGWKRAHVLTYPNGKRTMVTQHTDGRWRA